MKFAYDIHSLIMQMMDELEKEKIHQAVQNQWSCSLLKLLALNRWRRDWKDKKLPLKIPKK